MEHPLQERPLQKALNGLKNWSTTLKTAASDSLENLGSTSALWRTPEPAAQLRQQSPPSHEPASIANHQAQVNAFKQQLKIGGKIDMLNLRSLAFDGCPDTGNLRLIAWKLLLGVLPPDVQGWDQCMTSDRAEYQRFCEDLMVDPHMGSKSAASSTSPEALPEETLANDLDDHPLCTDANSRWHTFFKDSDVLEQIERDVRRTHPDMHFFSGNDEAPMRNRAEMCRALFIFAKLNMGLRYVQGMNELLAPLMWLCRADLSGGNSEHAEADSWRLFVALISEFRDHFCQQLDNTTIGIKATLGRLNDMLRGCDRELWFHLEVKNKVDPQFYAFRWITLLLTQEFEFPGVLRLWDTILSDPAGRTDCLLRLCLAMLLHVRDQLLVGDFSQNLRLLQRYPRVDVQNLLRLARTLKDDSASRPFMF